MNIIECPDCGGTVSRAAHTCPHCGRSFREQRGTHTHTLIVVGFIFLLIVVIMLSS